MRNIARSKEYKELLSYFSENESLAVLTYLARKLVSTEGFFVGQSAGAALWVASEIAKRPEAKGKNIVVILADNAFKYLSTNMYK